MLCFFDYNKIFVLQLLGIFSVLYTHFTG